VGGVPPPLVRECVGTGCQGPPAPPPPFAAPSTVTFVGVGNVPVSLVKSKETLAKKCAKGLERRHGGCVRAKRVKRKRKHTHKAGKSAHSRSGRGAK
jgi:hypothetical protein